MSFVYFCGVVPVVSEEVEFGVVVVVVELVVSVVVVLVFFLWCFFLASELWSLLIPELSELLAPLPLVSVLPLMDPALELPVLVCGVVADGV